MNHQALKTPDDSHKKLKIMHQDFTKNHFPFTAALLRDGEKDKKLVPSCTTINGYLCKLSSTKKKNIWVNTFTPIWNSRAMTEEQKKTILQKKIQMAEAIVNYPNLLFKFGKQEGYWIWNVEAAEKKKLEETKTVYTFSKKTDEYDDEGELSISKKNYPFEILAIIKQHCSEIKNRNYYEINSFSSLNADLEKIGWTLK